MTEGIKPLLKKILPQSFLNWYKRRSDQKQLIEWEQNGNPVPPPHIVKQNTIAFYQQQTQYRTLVETGTYLGDMVQAQKNRFKQVISIELDTALYQRAVLRFKHDKNIILLQGDSGQKMPEILSLINEPAIFWLDGHYSSGITAKGDKECPIFEELNAIFDNDKRNHVLLIDDARCFVGENDYPTIPELTDFIKRKRSDYQIEVLHDIIRCTVKN